MLVRRKIKKEDIDRELLDSIFNIEAEWKQMQEVISNSYSVDVISEGEQVFGLKQALYIFLLQEAKHRKLNALKY